MGKRNFHRRVSHGKALSNLWLQEVLQAECEYFAPIITNLTEIIKSCCFIAKVVSTEVMHTVAIGPLKLKFCIF